MKQRTIKYVKKCRICGKNNLVPILHLPQMPFTDDFVAPSAFGQEFRADIDVFVCQDCLTAQTQHDVDVNEYYEDYQYSVGSSATAEKFMRALAGAVKKKYLPETKDKKVLEVGSGDGGQLVAFKELGFKVLGYEPSSVLCKVAEQKGIPSVQGLFTRDSVNQLPEEFKKVNVIALSYTFDHLPEPRAFLDACTSILDKEEGLLVVEVHNLERIVERCEYCLFEHEHSIYLTEATAKQVCNMAGFEVIDFNLIPESARRANSLIFVATPKGSRFAPLAKKVKVSAVLPSVESYKQVADNIYKAIGNLDAFVDKVVSSGKTVAGYGAGGRGVMSLAVMKSAPKLRYLVDKKPKSTGLLAPKSGVPLVGIDQLKSNPVDEILVFSFGYMKEIQSELAKLGYKPEQLHSLLDVLAGRF